MNKLSPTQRVVLGWIKALKEPMTVAQIFARKPMDCLYQASDIGKALIFLQTQGLVMSEKKGAETVWFGA